MENNVGEIIRKIRKEKKMTLVQIAEITGLSHPYLSQLENGKKKNPSFETLDKIAQSLGMDYFELMIQAGFLSREDGEYRRKAKKESQDRLKEVNEYLENIKNNEISHQIYSVLDYGNPTFDGHIVTDQDKEAIMTILKAYFSGRDY